MGRTKDHLERLEPDECLRLLGSHPTHLGRIAFVDQGYPVVLPVNYRVFRGSVVFRTDPGSKFMAVAMGEKLAFEVDDVDEAWHEGWSVLVHGVAREVTEPDVLAAIDEVGLDAWAGASMHTVEFVQHRISGRRIV